MVRRVAALHLFFMGELNRMKVSFEEKSCKDMVAGNKAYIAA